MKTIMTAILLCVLGACSAGGTDPAANGQVDSQDLRTDAAGSAASASGGPAPAPEPTLPGSTSDGEARNGSATKAVGRPPDATLEDGGPEDTMPPPRVPSDP